MTDRRVKLPEGHGSREDITVSLHFMLNIYFKYLSVSNCSRDTIGIKLLRQNMETLMAQNFLNVVLREILNEIDTVQYNFFLNILRCSRITHEIFSNLFPASAYIFQPFALPFQLTPSIFYLQPSSFSMPQFHSSTVSFAVEASSQSFKKKNLLKNCNN